MTITIETIKNIAEIVGIIGGLIGLIATGVRWYLKNKEVEKRVGKVESENAMICFGLSATLDGLQQLGANHRVSEAKDALDKYLNKAAHGIE